MLRSRLVAVAATVWLMLWMVIGGAHHHESRTNSTDLEIVAGEALTSLESSQVVRDQLPPDHAHAERDSSTHHDDQFMAAALTPSVAALASFGAAVSPVGGGGVVGLSRGGAGAGSAHCACSALRRSRSVDSALLVSSLISRRQAVALRVAGR